VIAAAPTSVLAERTRRPNILIIVSDDQGWADIGYHGSDIMTPNLDRLAEAGVRIESHYVCPTCSPTRVALLAGRPPSRYGILGPIAMRSKQALPTETVTMARMLKSRGYRTGIVGKWHLGLRPEVGPRRYGFDHTYGCLHGGVNQYTHLYKNGDRTWHRNDEYIEETGHATDLIGAEAIRFIEAGGGEPFFLYVAFTAVHIPLQEPEHWTSMYDGKITHPSRKLFAACATHMDDVIGRIVGAIDRAGQRANTLIVFTSDNGGQKSWAHETQYGGGHTPNPVLGNNLPLRGWKGQLYEGGVRVPAFVSWPGVLEPAEIRATVSILDWLPTVAALVGYEAQPNLNWEGQNIWPLLTGKSKLTPRTLYWKTGAQVAARHGDWKLIIDRRDPDKLELFNLATDPYEQLNVAKAFPKRLAAVQEILEQQQNLDP